MGKVEFYRQALRETADWDAYLLRESGLPGPRGNIELARAAAEEGDQADFQRWLSYGPERAPANTPEEFLAFCGVLGQGKLLVAGHTPAWITLRQSANDPRWRVREAVAMALQHFGGQNMERLLAEMEIWSQGSRLEQRASAAGLCEPALLGQEKQIEQVLAILDGITASMVAAGDRQNEGYKVLRKGMAYCWSVAVAAHPQAGKPLMEKWLGGDDPDVRWLMKQNLQKKRLERVEPAWVAACLARIG